MLKKMISVTDSLCTGCIQCELACSIIHNGMANQLWSRIHIARDTEKGYCVPVVCRQCNPAPCVEICPVEALGKCPETGAIVIDENCCIQCNSCVFICPNGAISIAPDGSILVCDLCGGDPTCVKLCKERPENTCRYLSNPRASAIEYIDISTTSQAT